MSFGSGEDSHIQLILLVLYSRGLSTSKETELPEAELKWDSRSQASLVKGLSSGKGPQSRWELVCIYTGYTKEMNTQEVWARKITDDQQKELQHQWKKWRVLILGLWLLCPWGVRSWGEGKRRCLQPNYTPDICTTQEIMPSPLRCAVERRHRMKWKWSIKLVWL